jgi:hypothetical protein
MSDDPFGLQRNANAFHRKRLSHLARDIVTTGADGVNLAPTGPGSLDGTLPDTHTRSTASLHRRAASVMVGPLASKSNHEKGTIWRSMRKDRIRKSPE